MSSDTLIFSGVTYVVVTVKF